MITVQILEAHDVVTSEDWCRPLDLVSMDGGHSDYYSFESCYSGVPENNAKWVKVKYVLGKPWHGKTVAQIDRGLGEFLKYEFIRGKIPRRSQLNVSRYNPTVD